MNRLPTTFVAAVLAAAGSLHGQIFVSPTGSDTTGTGSSTNPVKTISFAASIASSGDTISLAPGTYGDDEQVVLGTKDLTIVGAGSGATVIVPHPTLVTSLPTGEPPGVPAEFRVVVLVDGPARIDLRNLTLNGDFRVPASGNLVGVMFRNGADGTVENVEIKNARDQTLAASPLQAAAVVRGDGSSDVCDVAFRNCWLHNWGRMGLLASFDSAVKFEYCTVQGAGPVASGGPVQVGVMVEEDARALLRYNTIADLQFTEQTDFARGIFALRAGLVGIESNRVARCDQCVAVVQDPPRHVTTNILQNRLTAARLRALHIEGATGVRVENNHLHAVELATHNVAWDNTLSGNVWLQNSYSDWNGTRPRVIAGSGANADPQPRQDCDDFSRARPGHAPTLGLVDDFVVADLNRRNNLDIATVNRRPPLSPTLSIRLADEFGNYHEIDNIEFGESGSRGAALGVGEFGGGAGQDLVAVTTPMPGSTVESRFHLFRNEGFGTFVEMHSQALPPQVEVPADIAVGDIDGNGLADFAIAYLGSPGGVLVYRNGGGFTSWTQVSLPGLTLDCRAVALARLDGGTTLDLAVTEGDGTSGRVRIYTNQGGLFTELASAAVPVDPNPMAMTIGDVSLDHVPDILVACLGGPTATVPGSVVILTNKLPGAWGVQRVPTDMGASSIALGDVGKESDPDTTRPDVVVANVSGGSITFLAEFGLAGPAQGGLSRAIDLNLGNAVARHVILADMDGDGYQDLVTSDRDRSWVYVRYGTPIPREDLYGAGCPGTGGHLPRISSAGVPAVARLGNASFGMRVDNAAPAAPAVMFLSVQPSPVLLPCLPMVGLTLYVTVATLTDATGSATLPLPIPNLDSFAGVSLFNQWVILDLQGGLLGQPLSSSPGLVFRIGR